MKHNHCVACGDSDTGDGVSLEHHHLIAKVLGGSDDEENLVTYCGPCHGKAHNISRPTNLGDLVKAGQAKAQERTAADYQEIAERRQGQADRAAEMAEERAREERRRERAELRREQRAAVPGRQGVCENPSCGKPIVRADTGRRKRFCSDECRRGTLEYRVGDLNRCTTVLSAETPKNSNEINQAKTPKTPSANGICGPRDGVESWRKWERVESTDGVVSHSTFVGKDVVAKCGFGKLAVFRDLGLLYRGDDA